MSKMKELLMSQLEDPDFDEDEERRADMENEAAESYYNHEVKPAAFVLDATVQKKNHNYFCDFCQEGEKKNELI